MKAVRKSTRRASSFAMLAGVLAAGLVLGVAELAGSFFSTRSAPLIALGSTFIDFTPSWLKDFAIDTFGTNDKLALFIGMAVTIVILAAILGYLAWRRWILGVAGVLFMGAVMVAAVVSRAGASALDAVPSVIGTLAGLAALRWMIVKLHAAVPAAAQADDDGVYSADEPSPERAKTGASRRAFFAAAGVTAVVAGATAAGGAVISAARSTVNAARRQLSFPDPVDTAKPVPEGVDVALEGVDPWLTPNPDFYRIDTALQVPTIDVDTWELRIHGMVEEEIRMNFQDLLDSELIERHITLTCVSNPIGGDLVGNAKWLGYPIRKLLERARPTEGADMVLSTSTDGFSASTPLPVLQDERDAIFAIAMNDEPLPLEHGYPVRMVVPGLYGYVSATKWVVDLEVTRFADATAYWTDRGWSEKGPIKTQSRVEVPKPFAKVAAGTYRAGGTAWAQNRGIDKVEVQIDDGPWEEATLAIEYTVDTWRQWTHEVQLEPGSHRIRSRAYDPDGVQVEERTDTVPNGASGWHSVQFSAE
ncbi:DMSO/TMAO reductase YedYZ molybdopterin-dependent catalytic subunit [Arthrobacter pigmenti]|uniref:DMSO/TMAO reductase YedYZ molybdopterin-dependent catalytic subunit n=1 Tax=Arthrobacter pigmenti TaxID=271432 RepID=A0A846RJG8_9MICC|nr:molybdopterin-dependent oxidoreductase [Arthrobacter pigmenti]NJC23448.1 DMSO/TMAO reductase YedYZ molybdopterin-dependent catalytic subunit [Arthrobacter pigmenti]